MVSGLMGCCHPLAVLLIRRQRVSTIQLEGGLYCGANASPFESSLTETPWRRYCFLQNLLRSAGVVPVRAAAPRPAFAACCCPGIFLGGHLDGRAFPLEKTISAVEDLPAGTTQEPSIPLTERHQLELESRIGLVCLTLAYTCMNIQGSKWTAQMANNGHHLVEI